MKEIEVRKTDRCDYNYVIRRPFGVSSYDRFYIIDIEELKELRAEIDRMLKAEKFKEDLFREMAKFMIYEEAHKREKE